MILTLKEVKWLDSHGGRTEADVLLDEVGEKYVYMSNMRVSVRVYINAVKPVKEIREKRVSQSFTSFEAWSAYSMKGRIEKAKNVV